MEASIPVFLSPKINTKGFRDWINSIPINVYIYRIKPDLELHDLLSLSEANEQSTPIDIYPPFILCVHKDRLLWYINVINEPYTPMTYVVGTMERKNCSHPVRGDRLVDRLTNIAIQADSLLLYG